MRAATEQERQLTYQVKKAAFREYVEKVFGWDEAEQVRLHNRRFSRDVFKIISVADVDVGFMVSSIEHDCIHLKQLFLLPEHQGRGVGQICMAQVLAAAQSLNLPVRLRVLKVNPRALAFYERLGFVQTSETDTHHFLELAPNGNSRGIP